MSNRDARQAFRRGSERLPRMIIGVDFDNTIVSYDALMHRVAREWQLIDESTGSSKRNIRDAIRNSPHGELAWQRLQIAAYGTRIAEATPADGVKAFFARCKTADIPVRIVSHKTVYPNLGEPRVNLRDAALQWLEQHGFVSGEDFGIGREHVYFESTRTEKVARIASLSLTHFIDDLEETFAEPGFPENVVRILYSVEHAAAAPSVTALASWNAITEHFWPRHESVSRAGSRV